MLSLFFSYAALLVPRTDIIFPSLETLLCCLIWVTIFLWCSTSHKHSPLCTSLLCGIELGQKLLSVQRAGHELLVSWCLKHKNLLSLLFILYACQVYILFFICKKFDKGLCDCATSELFQGSLGDCGCELEKQVFMRSEWCIGTDILSCA